MEEWRPVPGYDGIYEASSLGRIRTAPGKTTSNARYPIRVWKSRIMKFKHPHNSKRHDARVSLWREGKQKDYLVARVIAMSWHGVPDDGMTVNHINGNYLDNRPENLEWVSLSDNIKHAFDNGLCDSFLKKITLVDQNKVEHTFKSLSQADRFLGRASGYTSNALLKNHKIRSIEGTVYTPKTRD